MKESEAWLENESTGIEKCPGAGVVAQEVKPQPRVPHPMRVLIQVLIAPLLVQFPDNVPVKAAEDGLHACAPITHKGNLDGVPGS